MAGNARSRGVTQRIAPTASAAPTGRIKIEMAKRVGGISDISLAKPPAK